MSIDQDALFSEWLPAAKQAGLSYTGYWKRVHYRGMSPQEAATKPKQKGGRPISNESIQQMCKRAGVGRRTFYNIREELKEMGPEATKERVIEIASSRKRAPKQQGKDYASVSRTGPEDP